MRATRGMVGPCEPPVADLVEFDPSDSTQRRYDGYGPAKLPCGRDREVQVFVDQLRRDGPRAVAAALAAISEEGRRVLRAYAERMASLAVRTGEVEQLERAIVAVVVGGLDDNAYEALMAMPLIEDGARRVGIEPPELFEKAAAIVGHPGTINLVRWLSRKPEDRSLASMGFVESADKDGFRYRLDW